MIAYVPHLPAEIHCLIAQYVHRDDLPSYRLANRQLCVMGTEELFGTIVFHYSTASIDRLNRLSANGRLRRHVKTIFWDVNLWSLNNVRDFHEWKRYFAQKAEVDRVRNASFASSRLYVSGYTQLSQNQREWEAYLDKVADEKRARTAWDQLGVIGCFQNLRSIHVVNGVLLSAHRGLQKVADKFPSALPAPAVLRRGLGTNDFDSMPGVEAFVPIQRHCRLFLKRLKLNRVHPKCFPFSTRSSFDNLSSLNITLAPWMYLIRNEAKHSVMDGLSMFLARSTQLESLRIDLNHENARLLVDKAVLTIRQVFGSEQTWSKLRKLSLCHFFATPDTLVSFLGRHSSTLKDLRLHNTSWTEVESDIPEQKLDALSASTRHCAWPQVLQEMSELLDLERASVSGKLGENTYVLGWQLGGEKDELAAAVSDYLISGGQCPLTDENADFDPEFDPGSESEGSEN